MKYYVVKDGTIQAETATKKAAIELIRAYQETEKQYYIRATFSIIEGKPEEFISYVK